MARSRKRTTSRVRASQSDGIHRFKRTVNLGAITAGAVDGGSGRSVTLNAFPNATEFSNLYNEYRITKLEFKYILNNHILASGKAYPRLTFCVDHNDASNPVLESDLLQYKGVREFQFGQTSTVFTHRFKPKVAVSAFQGTFAGYANPGNVWLNCDYPTIQYYGIKEWLSNYNTTLASGASVQLYVTAWIEARQVR